MFKLIQFKNYRILNYIFICAVLASCGRTYFPIELDTISRSEREKKQESGFVRLVPITKEEIKRANSIKYTRKIIDAGNLNKPARIITTNVALKEVLPENNDPGSYIIGVGDQITYSEVIQSVSNNPTFVSRVLSVSDNGYLKIYGIGDVKAEGKTQAELEDLIFQKLVQSGKKGSFELSITGFNSKKIYLYGDNLPTKSLRYTNFPIFLEDVISSAGLVRVPGQDAKLMILRKEREYIFSLSKLLASKYEKYRLFPNDKIFITPLNYSREVVLLVGETGAQRAIPITSFLRPTLADTIFNGNVLNSSTSDFSQIYVIREQKNEFNAYHLDITNPTRIKLANTFEMRPDDIVFVAAQPLTNYSRTLAQILGTVGLTQQARDQLRAEFKINSN